MTLQAEPTRTASAVESTTSLRSRNSVAADAPSLSNETSLLSLLALLLRERRAILTTTVVALAVSLAVVLLTARTYTTNFSFVPQAGQDQSRSGLANLAGQFGLSIGAAAGGAQSPQLYADLLKTRETLEPIARDSFAVETGGPRLALADFLKVSGENSPVILDRTVKSLRSRISSSVAMRTTGMVSVSVTTREPSISLEIAKRLLRGVSDFNLDTRRSQGGEERRFTEGRLVDARRSLRGAEDRLESFLVANRQIANAPQLEFQRTRLERDVGLQQQVVSGLSQSYEEARIREVRDTPVISLIESPALAAVPDSRGGLVIMSIGAASGVLAGILLALFRANVRRMRDDDSDPDVRRLMTEWRKFRGSRVE